MDFQFAAAIRPCSRSNAIRWAFFFLVFSWLPHASSSVVFEETFDGNGTFDLFLFDDLMNPLQNLDEPFWSVLDGSAQLSNGAFRPQLSSQDQFTVLTRPATVGSTFQRIELVDIDFMANQPVGPQGAVQISYLWANTQMSGTAISITHNTAGFGGSDWIAGLFGFDPATGSSIPLFILPIAAPSQRMAIEAVVNEASGEISYFYDPDAGDSVPPQFLETVVHTGPIGTNRAVQAIFFDDDGSFSGGIDYWIMQVPEPTGFSIAVLGLLFACGWSRLRKRRQT